MQGNIVEIIQPKQRDKSIKDNKTVAQDIYNFAEFFVFEKGSTYHKEKVVRLFSLQLRSITGVD